MIHLLTWACEHIEPCYNICTAMDVHCRYVIVCYNYYVYRDDSFRGFFDASSLRFFLFSLSFAFLLVEQCNISVVGTTTTTQCCVKTVLWNINMIICSFISCNTAAAWLTVLYNNVVGLLLLTVTNNRIFVLWWLALLASPIPATDFTTILLAL